MIATTSAAYGSTVRDVKGGNRLFAEQEYKQAEELYRKALESDPESDIIYFNLGTVLYKSGEYGDAMDHFRKSLLGETKELKENAYFNLGNSFFQLGISKKGTNLSLKVLITSSSSSSIIPKRKSLNSWRFKSRLWE